MLSANPLVLLAYSPILDSLFKFSDLAGSHSVFLFKTPIYVKTKKKSPHVLLVLTLKRNPHFPLIYSDTFTSKMHMLLNRFTTVLLFPVLGLCFSEIAVNLS